MDGKRTLVLLLDAFRKDYIIKGDMVFLSQLDKKFNGCTVTQSFGFCERTEILHGKTPENGGFFTAIAKKEHQNAHYNRYRKVVNLILKNKSIDKVVRLGFQLLFKAVKGKTPLYKIPIAELGMWEFTEDRIDITNPNIYENSPLKELAEKYRISFTHFTSLDKPVVVKDDDIRIFKAIDEFNDNDIVFVYYGLTDYLAHIYGPDSKSFSEFLKELDKKLRLLHEKLSERNIKLTILGDHGMLSVDNQFDIKLRANRILESLGLYHTKDYITFTDSTLHRIYLHEKSNISNISELLANSIDQEIAINKNSIYGDIIIEANNGELFYPNNFNSMPLKGMHGYRSTSDENKGYFLSELNIDGSKTEGNLDLKDFMFRLQNLLS